MVCFIDTNDSTKIGIKRDNSNKAEIIFIAVSPMTITTYRHASARLHKRVGRISPVQKKLPADI